MTNYKLLQKLAKQRILSIETEIIPNVLESAFKEQLDFINDPSHTKAACSSRRAGKSSAVGLYLVNECLTKQTNVLYLARTKEAAENIMWTDVFDNILKKYEIKANPGTSKLQIKFDNGSILYLTGADASEGQMRKLVGKKYSLVVIDECQNFENDLNMLVHKVLMPTLADANGTICLVGTPGNNMTDASYWFKVATKKEPGWSLHQWHWRQNPHVKNNMEKQIARMIEDNPLIVKTPFYRMEYENEWVPETDARVYQSQDYNFIDKHILPKWFYNDCIYILSLDLGYYDATAFVIGAYNLRYDNNLYILESFKQSGLIISSVANIIKDLQKKYKFSHIVVDAANTQAVEEMRQIHSLPLTAADKHGKEAHIALLNGDLITRNLYIIAETNKDLKHELDTLIWDQKALLRGQHKENAKYENHLSDALLYCHFFSRAYFFRAVTPPLPFEEQIVTDIEKQFLNKKSTIRQIRTPWWNNSVENDND